MGWPRMKMEEGGFSYKKMFSPLGKITSILTSFRDVALGDVVTVGECRPLSKTVRFNVLKVTKAAGSKKGFKKFWCVHVWREKINEKKRSFYLLVCWFVFVDEHCGSGTSVNNNNTNKRSNINNPFCTKETQACLPFVIWQTNKNNMQINRTDREKVYTQLYS